MQYLTNFKLSIAFNYTIITQNTSNRKISKLSYTQIEGRRKMYQAKMRCQDAMDASI